MTTLSNSERGRLPKIRGIEYAQHAAIIRLLQESPDTYDANTGWTDLARRMYMELYQSGYGVNGGKGPDGFIGGDGI